MCYLSMVAALSFTQITEICESHVLKDKHIFWLTEELILSGCSFTLDKLQSRGTRILFIPSAIRWLNLNMEFSSSVCLYTATAWQFTLKTDQLLHCLVGNIGISVWFVYYGAFILGFFCAFSLVLFVLSVYCVISLAYVNASCKPYFPYGTTF